MILARYLPAIAYVDRDPVVSYLVRRDLDLPLGRSMPYALHDHGLGQADLILSLLRINTRGSRLLIERILGRPIMQCQSVLLQWRSNGRPQVRRQPRISHVVANPRKPNTDAYRRFERSFKKHFTIEQCRSRGARQRDVRGALRRGWIRLEEVTS
jgi:hypothetical protein